MTLANPREVWRWLLYGGTLCIVALIPLLFGPDDLSVSEPSVAMTMSFVVLGFGTLFTGLSVRRDPESGLVPPIVKALGILAIPAVLMLLATESELIQRFLSTEPLTASQWGGSIALAAAVLVVIEADKAVRRRRDAQRPFQQSGPEPPIIPVSVASSDSG